MKGLTKRLIFSGDWIASKMQIMVITTLSFATWVEAGQINRTHFGLDFFTHKHRHK
jgi:hypothetical protein